MLLWAGTLSLLVGVWHACVDRETRAVTVAKAGNWWCSFRHEPLWAMSRHQANPLGEQVIPEDLNSSSSYLDYEQMPIGQTLPPNEGKV
jgi:hypothetical protein